MNSNSRGFLEKFSWGALVAGIATFFALFFGFPEYIFNLRPQIQEAIGVGTIFFIEGTIAGSVVTIIVLKLLGSRGKGPQHQKKEKQDEEMTIDPRFAHLTIHYSQRTDTPDTLNPARPKLVVDNERKRYYWVPTWLERPIKQHKIPWHTHDGEKALRTWLKKEKIEPHETDPTPEELGLENLLETDCSNVEPKKSIGKVEEKSPLIQVYSPIHAMIVRVNREIPRESALQLTVGMPVKASLIDSNSISAVFNQHNDKLRKKDLDMWLEIEKEIKARNCFFLGKDRQKWFDELENEYNRLTKH